MSSSWNALLRDYGPEPYPVILSKCLAKNKHAGLHTPRLCESQEIQTDLLGACISCTTCTIRNNMRCKLQSGGSHAEAPSRDHPQSTYTELQHFLAAPSSPSLPKFCFVLATLLAPMIGHVRLLQTKKDKPPMPLNGRAKPIPELVISLGNPRTWPQNSNGSGNGLKKRQGLEFSTTLTYSLACPSTPLTSICQST